MARGLAPFSIYSEYIETKTIRRREFLHLCSVEFAFYSPALFLMERYPRGSRGPPAKGLAGQKPGEGSNPSLSAIENEVQILSKM